MRVCNDELYHYGKLGMKWGRHKKLLKNNNTRVDHTNKKTSTAKKIIIGAAVTSAIIGGVYGSYKLSQSRDIDRTIKVGKDFFRRGSEKEASNGLNDIIYATFKKSDKKLYEHNSALSDKVNYKIRSSRNIRIAGNKNAERIYNNLIKDDKDFASHYKNMSYKDFNGMIGYANKILINNKIPLDETYMSPYFKKLASEGYHAIVDTQDKFSKIPVILIKSMADYTITK